MNGPLNGAGSGSFTSSLIAISDLGQATGEVVTDLQGIEFSDLIDQQNAVPGLLEELKGLLPEQDFSQIEAFIDSGNRLPSAADPGSNLELSLGVVPFPTAASLAVARQQFASAHMAEGEQSPALRLAPTESGLLPGLMDGKSVPGNTVMTAGGGVVSPLSGGAEQAGTSGFTMELLKAELEAVTHSRGSALQESASSVQANPLAALKPAEAALPMRIGSTGMPVLETPLTAKGWEQGVGDRVMWMLGNSIQGASLRINPAHLGPIEIQLSMQQDQATVTFNAQHAVVREALEASIPRLREMFQENNLQLTNVDVGQRGSSEQQTAEGGADGSSDASAGNTFERSDYDTDEAEAPIVVQGAIEGMLDDYA